MKALPPSYPSAAAAVDDVGGDDTIKQLKKAMLGDRQRWQASNQREGSATANFLPVCILLPFPFRRCTGTISAFKSSFVLVHPLIG